VNPDSVERARSRGLQQTWLAAPGGTPPPSPPRSASRLTPCSPSTPRVETHLFCGDLTDFRQFSCVCVCVFVCVYVCVYVDTYTHVYTHTYCSSSLYIHTHTHNTTQTRDISMFDDDDDDLLLFFQKQNLVYIHALCQFSTRV
jgi:hypothetical protein